MLAACLTSLGMYPLIGAFVVSACGVAIELPIEKVVLSDVRLSNYSEWSIKIIYAKNIFNTAEWLFGCLSSLLRRFIYANCVSIINVAKVKTEWKEIWDAWNGNHFASFNQRSGWKKVTTNERR